jgi:elongation factor G
MRASSKDHPIVSIVVNSLTGAADERLLHALTELTRLDKTVRVIKCVGDGEFVLEGWRVAQLQVISDRVRDEFGIETELGPPRAVLLDTVRETAVGEGKYIRQTSGLYNYGHCKLCVEPNQLGKGYEFFNSVSDGRIPEEYVLAIDRGVQGCLLDDARPRHPLVDLKVTLIDGSFHESDSNPQAFECASEIAFKQALTAASTVVLEPMMRVEIGVPEDLAEAIAHDVTKRRGRIEQMDTENSWAEITAIMPFSELLGSVSQGLAAFPMEFAGYQPMPEDRNSDEMGTGAPVSNPRLPRHGGISEAPPFDPQAR